MKSIWWTISFLFYFKFPDDSHKWGKISQHFYCDRTNSEWSGLTVKRFHLYAVWGSQSPPYRSLALNLIWCCCRDKLHYDTHGLFLQPEGSGDHVLICIFVKFPDRCGLLTVDNWAKDHCSIIYQWKAELISFVTPLSWYQTYIRKARHCYNFNVNFV